MSRFTTVSSYALLWQQLVFHASVFQHFSPLATSTGVAVFQVLAEVIGAAELLRPVAFAEFVGMVEMFSARLPLRRISEFLTAVTADVHAAVNGCRRMEGGFQTTGEHGA